MPLNAKVGNEKTCAACGGQYGPEVLYCPLDGSPLSRRSTRGGAGEPDPYLDLELPGQIRVQALVGIGSMGRVYRAFQSGVDRDVAVKILHRELCGNPELVARFHREAKIASKLLHPNVVQVLMTGSLAGAGGGADIARTSSPELRSEVYLVMEYLDGISLLSALAAQGEGGALPLARTLHVILQICDAVGAAHALGIVHRDLKPDNIMLVRRAEDPDFVKILDFGIARLDSFEGSATQAGRIFGTAKYISPEGAEGKLVGPPADVYSIATVLYQCLAGRTPFEGDSPMAVLVQQMHGEPTPLREIERAAYVPDPVARVVMQNLSKDPSKRADNAKTLGRDLTQAARDAGLHLDSIAFGLPKGDLRLVSMQRTRQHEFTPELKAQIAAASSATARRPMTEVVDGTLIDQPPPPAPPPPSSRRAGPESDHDGPTSGRPGFTEIPADEAGGDDTIHGSLEPAPPSVAELRARGVLAKPAPTMPGDPVQLPAKAEPPPPGPASRPRFVDNEPREHVVQSRWSAWKIAALVAALVVPLGVVAALRLTKPAPVVVTEDELLARAEIALERRAWTSPPGENVKELTDAVLVDNPGDRRALELRRIAAQELVSDAVTKKGARDFAAARSLVALAKELSPGLESAAALEAMLEPTAAPTATAAPPPPEPSARPSAKGPRPGTPSSASRPSATSSSESLAPPAPPDLTPPPAGSGTPWL
jgi:serine/threonine-protein kinase